MPLEPLPIYCVLGKVDVEFQRGWASQYIIRWNTTLVPRKWVTEIVYDSIAFYYHV
jgi:hypothetical protein